MTDVATRPAEVISEDDARKLTTRIRRGAENLRDLILEAHEKGADKALGYKSWTAYVAAEFDIAPGHAGRLLFQAKAIKELAAATGLPTTAVADAVSARAAAELGPEGIGQVAQDVQEHDQGNGKRTPLLERARNLRETVQERRAAAREATSPPGAEPAADEGKPDDADGSPVGRSAMTRLDKEFEDRYGEAEPGEPAEAPTQAQAPAGEAPGIGGPPDSGRGARRHPGVILPTGDAPPEKLAQAAKVLQQILQLPPALVASTYLKVPPELRLVDPVAMPNLIEAWADAFADELVPF